MVRIGGRGATPFFCYGTLMSGEYNSGLLRGTYQTQEALLLGYSLLDNGAFPYAVEDAGGFAKGEVLFTTEMHYTENVRRLDMLEGYQEGATRNHYDRVLVEVQTDSGAVSAWCYVASKSMQRRLASRRLPVIEPPRLQWRLSTRERMRVMGAPRKYPEELRERAIHLVIDARRDPVTRVGAFRRVGDQLGVNPETLRNWVTQVEIDQGQRVGTSTTDAQRLLALERENRELRRANAISKSASAFFAAELDRPHR